MMQERQGDACENIWLPSSLVMEELITMISDPYNILPVSEFCISMKKIIFNQDLNMH